MNPPLVLRKWRPTACSAEVFYNSPVSLSLIFDALFQDRVNLDPFATITDGDNVSSNSDCSPYLIVYSFSDQIIVVIIRITDIFFLFGTIDQSVAQSLSNFARGALPFFMDDFRTMSTREISYDHQILARFGFKLRFEGIQGKLDVFCSLDFEKCRKSA